MSGFMTRDGRTFDPLIDSCFDLAVPHFNQCKLGGYKEAIEQHKKHDDGGLPKQLASTVMPFPNQLTSRGAGD